MASWRTSPVTAEAVLAAGVQRVGLLGTSFTMERPFLRHRLAEHGLDVTVPDADDRALVHRVIYDELCRGIVSEVSRAAFRAVIARLVDGGALFPTTRVHVEAAVAAALA